MKTKEMERGAEARCPGCGMHILAKGLRQGLKGFCRRCSNERFNYPRMKA
jgi:DNA-directed RNA polymerase subunit RPC12/RpoP